MLKNLGASGFSILLLTFALPAARSLAQTQPYDDHQNMMDQLGLKALRPGPNPNDQSTFDEAKANPYADSMPDVLTMNDGRKVTTAAQWPARRAEIAEDFEREVYGRIPPNVPAVAWDITATTHGVAAGIATVTRTLVGHVDNSAYPQVTVNIQATLTVPENATAPVPVIVTFSFPPFRRPLRAPGNARPNAFPAPVGPTWQEQAIAHGWGYALFIPTSVQPDNNHLLTGIIGLTNRGKPRTPDQWGALRAWQWGVSRLIDCFEQHPEFKVDATKVGIEGLSRYGKAALVTEAFEPRIAVGLIGSSGEGGAKLHRHIFGEAVENLAGGEYYWMAGNFMKYGASDPPKTVADLPVDSHELIAMCAPRPCFISYGVVEHGDAKWVDAHGSFMAAVLASPVYELLGAKGLGIHESYLTAPMPPPLTLIGGQLAWRQHEGGHDVTPNWPSFFEWVAAYIEAPPLPTQPAAAADSAAVPAPRTDANSMLAHQQLLAKAKAGGIDLYFLGDSITRRWGCTDPQWSVMLANWKQNFFGWNAADFGWGADRIQNILWRVENGELDGVNPKVIVILAGTNNVGNQAGPEGKVDDILNGFDALIAACRNRAPGAAIILTGIFPRNDNLDVLPEIRQINEGLAAKADGKTIFYVNINDKLADGDGRLYDGMTVDKLHPTVKGYQIWADALNPILTRLLGPKSATDHAPPPTGDPSLAVRQY
ncbi:MAG TPA: GDSL-type esterase/lipase family protein [Tepidisphaeraceae bacterium]|nr:GDSL-type esterase/lipase family protein [Tepidisphaeraceae bacterium]